MTPSLSAPRRLELGPTCQLAAPFQPRRERQLPTGSRHNVPGMALLLFVLIHFAAAAAAESSHSPATALFVLGDSTVSCASSILPLNLTAPSLSSAGPCLFPSGRRLLPDLLAAKMGLPPPPLIYTLNGTATAAARGVNFGGQYGDRGIFRMGAVGQQLRLATETLQLLQLETGTPQDAPSAAAAAGAVFVLSFGTDAYARLLARGPAEADAAAPKHGRRGLGRLLADRIARAVAELYEAEVRRVAVIGVAPLGCAPRVMWEAGGGRGCVEEANELIEGYNARLAARLDDLRPQLPGADVVFCDVYKGMMEIISNPRRYGLDETWEACCGVGPFKATVGCLSKEMACGAPERRVWWDLYTPTDAVAALVANWSWSSPPPATGSGSGDSDVMTMMSICSPMSLQQLAAGS
ncbi:GDSL esterase/lipase At5g55050 [Setaria viridis]|nr:GDSL esterase/lipase At5g55050-like [Setaria viridis]